MIDAINYGPQKSDVSEGLSPSGSQTFAYFKTPTPGALNPGSGSGNVSITYNITPIFNFNHPWRMETNGVPAPSDWTTTNFNDSAWKTGTSLFGVETSSPYPYPLPISTPLPLLAGATRIKTFYFRTHFTVSTTTGIALWATNYLDDGAVFYLNGARVGSIRVSDNPANYNSDAVLQPVEGESDLLILPPDNLVLGDNVLAVEVHQSGNNSSDVVFGMSLSSVETITNVVSPDSMPVLLNEVLVLNDSIRNSSGAATPWVELFNPSTNSLDLAGLSLTDDPGNPRKWIFPAGSQIAPTNFLVIAFDTNSPASISNSAIHLGRNDGSVYLFNRPEDGGGELDAISYGLQTANFSIGRVPDGSEDWQLNIPSEKSANLLASLGAPQALRINEWMADPLAGADWFEVYNTDNAPVSFLAWLLPMIFRLPANPLSAPFLSSALDLAATFNSWLTNLSVRVRITSISN